MFNLFSRERIRQAERFLKGDMEPTFAFCICSGNFPLSKREHAQFLCMNQGGNAGKARSLFRARAFVFSRRRKTDYGKRTSTSDYEDGRGLCTVVHRYCKKQNLLIIQV